MSRVVVTREWWYESEQWFEEFAEDEEELEQLQNGDPQKIQEYVSWLANDVTGSYGQDYDSQYVEY